MHEILENELDLINGGDGVREWGRAAGKAARDAYDSAVATISEWLS